MAEAPPQHTLILNNPVHYAPEMSDEKIAGFAHYDQSSGDDNKAFGEAHIDPALDLLITRKFDRRVVPWLFGLWLLAFIDRSNIGMFNSDCPLFNCFLPEILTRLLQVTHESTVLPSS